jgi:hypothetical protein
MNILSADSHYSHAFGASLPLAALRSQVPAIFAERPSPKTKQTYRFISTSDVLLALYDNGFEVSAARQTRSRASSDPSYARHLIRLRRRRETIQLHDATPELALENCHDGGAAWTLRAAIFRAICSNGLISLVGDFGFVRVPHRISIVTDVVAAALQIASQFELMASSVQAMVARTLSDEEQIAFAHAAIAIRWPDPLERPAVTAAMLLQVRRSADDFPTVWHIYNRIQEACVRGGLQYSTATSRQVTTRTLHGIREDIRINTALWSAAAALAS